MNISRLETKLIERNASINAYLDSIKNFEVPSTEKEIELFNKIKNGDDNARKELIMGHQRIVYSFAKQYAKTNNEIIDYVNEGNIGLMKAIESFDSTKGFKFMTYAQHYVRREMNYYLKTTNTLVERSNSLRIDPKLKKINTEYFNEHGCYPSIEVVKQLLEEKYNIVVKNSSDLYDVCFASSDIPKNSDLFDYEFNNEYNKKTLSVNAYDKNVENEHMKYMINSMLSTLDDRERDVISMSFGVGKYDCEHSTEDIAYKYNVTTACINTIKKKALEKMKTYSTRKIAV